MLLVTCVFDNFFWEHQVLQRLAFRPFMAYAQELCSHGANGMCSRPYRGTYASLHDRINTTARPFPSLRALSWSETLS